MSPPRFESAILLLGLLCCACSAPDPKQEVEIAGLETYWAIDPSHGETHYLAPVVRFQLRNKGTKAHRSIETQATFRRKGEEGVIWSSAWARVTGPGGQPLPVGATSLVVLKPEGEGRYYSSAPPEAMFSHQLFRDATVQVFVRVGASAWLKLAVADVERRIGSKSVQE